MYLATPSVAHTDAAHPLPGPGLFFAICGMDHKRYLVSPENAIHWNKLALELQDRGSHPSK